MLGKVAKISLKLAVEYLDMEVIGDEVQWRIQDMEVDLHGMDLMDLEQSKNSSHKVIHMMWTRLSRQKNLGWTQRGDILIVRSGRRDVRYCHAAIVWRIAQRRPFCRHLAPTAFTRCFAPG